MNIAEIIMFKSSKGSLRKFSNKYVTKNVTQKLCQYNTIQFYFTHNNRF